jgi:hypothetical protein
MWTNRMMEQRQHCSASLAEKSGLQHDLLRIALTKNPSAADPKFAQAFGASNANFGFKGGTRKEIIASVLIDSEVRTSVPQC